MITEQPLLEAVARGIPGAELVHAEWLEDNDRYAEAPALRLAVQMRAIIATPEDDTQRLQYAEMCDAFGMKERAAFIRIQVELADRRNWPCSEGCRDDTGHVADCANVEWNRLNKVSHDLLLGKTKEWSSLPDTIDNMSSVWSRGFVEEVTASWEDWGSNWSDITTTSIGIAREFHTPRADAVLASQPVQTVWLTSVPRIQLGVIQMEESQDAQGWVKLRFYRPWALDGVGQPYLTVETVFNGWGESLDTVRAKLRQDLERASTVEAHLRRRWPTVKQWVLPTGG